MKWGHFLALFILFSCAHTPTMRSPASREMCLESGLECPFLVIGHRGAPYEFAENTIPAFSEALRQGANALEIDLVMTKDEKVAVYHDRSPGELLALIRQMGVEGQRYITFNPAIGDAKRLPTEELTLNELREFYGYALSRGFLADTFTNNVKDESAIIPSLDDFAQWADQEKNLYAVFLDIKLIPGQEAQALKMAESFAKAFQASPYRVYMMTAYDEIYEVLQEWVIQNPAAANRFLTLDMEKPDVRERMRKLRNKLKTKVKSLGLGSTPLRDWNEYKTELEQILKGRSLATKKEIYPVVSWTIDDQKKLYELLQTGVDGILTNRPARLNRLLERHWKDHSTIAKALAACQQQDVNQICTDGARLNPLSSVTYDELRRWVCDELHTHEKLRDLYGCGGVLDKKNIYFDHIIESSNTNILYKDQNGVVKVGESLGKSQSNPYLLSFTQEKCFDGVVNHGCEFELHVEVYQQDSWQKINGKKQFENSFSQVLFLPEGAKKVRIFLNETDDGVVSEEAVLYLDAKSSASKRFQSKNRVFQGELLLNKLNDLRTDSVRQDVVLEFDEKDCNDGFLNNSCEYKLRVELFNEMGQRIDTRLATDLSGSFQLYASWPKEVSKLKINISEWDGEQVTGESEVIVSLDHGETVEVNQLQNIFSGELKILLIDYDQNSEHSEGFREFRPHIQKSRQTNDWLKVLP